MFTTLLLLAACSGAPTTAQTPVQRAPEPAPAQDTGLVAHMSQHFEKATAARDAVIAGDLDGARAALEWVATHQEADGLPDGVHARVERMRATARSGAESSTAPAVGRSVAALAMACGECHASVGAEPVATPLSEDAHPHQRAAEQMWWGLVGPESGAWVAAAQTVKATGGRDPVAADAAERVELYGDWIASCAPCHAEKGVTQRDAR